jgi:ferric-dicitrate binding protein FerR (iron transport regulator)
MSLQEAKQFVAYFIKGEYSPEEYAAFLLWLKGATIDELNAIADEHEALHEHWVIPSAVASSEWVEGLERKLDGVNDDRSREEFEVPVIHIRKGRFSRRKTWVAAASVVVLLAGGTIVYVTQKGSGTEQMKQVRPGIQALNKTFSNPRGGEQKQLILADGSKVWLNAASSLKYPSTFTGPERLVELSGEAFFEVKKNSGNPFRVLIKDAEVEVLGTDFNVMAYQDEPVSRTTLVEGAVKIENGSAEVVLQPGQQAEIPNAAPGTASIKVLSGIDPRKVLAWKSGLFKFDNDELHTVMRVLSRCYNVDVQYDPKVPAVSGEVKITGIFDRKDGLDKILAQLESQGIHFTNDGKTVTVKAV